ncbi:MAG TPA: flavin reductase family protein [Gallionellaceae bacterium]|nr:flavin reductase family protein [Gallionellaceae bacterium]
MHRTIEPPILYFGTPVVLIGTRNQDGTPNLAPMSSAFWLGWRCVLGIAASSRTYENLMRSRECVINLPSAGQVAAVNRLALTTGSDPVPERKQARGYRHVADKFAAAGFSEAASERVSPPRVRECPIQLEAVVEGSYALARDTEGLSGFVVCFETRILRVHADDAVLAAGEANRIDPDRWRPLIMSFQRFYGLGPELQASTLANIPERSYYTPDIDRARAGT